MMREAAKMQQDPAFQARMNQVMANPQFQEHMDKQKEVLKDEAKVKDLEESPALPGQHTFDKIRNDQSH